MTGSELSQERRRTRWKDSLRRALGPWGVFFEGFVKHPVMVGSIIPSSKRLIDRIAGNGWRVPHDINPTSYKPAPAAHQEDWGIAI